MRRVDHSERCRDADSLRIDRQRGLTQFLAEFGPSREVRINELRAEMRETHSDPCRDFPLDSIPYT